MQFVTRISYNSSGWRKPTAEARHSEQRGSYNQMFGFGHEDWLLRNEWKIDGWRYAFLQGVNKSLSKLRNANLPFGVRLFCVEPDRRRRYVGEIVDVECLSETHAKEALQAYKTRGWLAEMRQEVSAVGGDASALGRPDFATHILNIRFRSSSLRLYPSETYAAPSDPVRFFNRYSLIAIENVLAKYATQRRRRVGSEDPPSLRPIIRDQAAKRVEISPAHSLMQVKLMAALRLEFPEAQVIREEGFVDIIVRTQSQRMFFEIKSMLSPSETIREALGQLLEYLYHVGADAERATSLIIVGRTTLSAFESSYFEWIKSNVTVPLNYRVVEI